MKKLLTMCLLILAGGMVNAQEMKSTAKVESAQKIADFKKSGKYEFELPAATTAAGVKKTAAYYTQYFTVQFDDKTKKATLVLTQNEPMNRQVMERFLISNEVREILMDGQTYKVQPFFTEFVK
jgi:hypothetical protein